MAVEGKLRQPAALVTCTVKLPDVVTSILDVVAPFDQRYVAPALAVRVTLPPVQNVKGPPAEITGVTGIEFTVTVVTFEAGLRHPPVFVTCTE